jgi:hypothetical protein
MKVGYLGSAAAEFLESAECFSAEAGVEPIQEIQGDSRIT